jgi:hypothetical protein
MPLAWCAHIHYSANDYAKLIQKDILVCKWSHRENFNAPKLLISPQNIRIMRDHPFLSCIINAAGADVALFSQSCRFHEWMEMGVGARLSYYSSANREILN